MRFMDLQRICSMNNKLLLPLLSFDFIVKRQRSARTYHHHVGLKLAGLKADIQRHACAIVTAQQSYPIVSYVFIDQKRLVLTGCTASPCVKYPQSIVLNKVLQDFFVLTLSVMHLRIPLLLSCVFLFGCTKALEVRFQFCLCVRQFGLCLTFMVRYFQVTLYGCTLVSLCTLHDFCRKCSIKTFVCSNWAFDLHNNLTKINFGPKIPFCRTFYSQSPQVQICKIRNANS